MKHLVLIIILMAATSAMAINLDSTAPAKPVTNVMPQPADPDVLRQGGDTIADAVAIPIPYAGTGTTEGFVDDYDEVCPYTSSLSTDVVYSLTPESSMEIDIDMLGSAYDTKIYVYDQDMNVLDCNDDFHPDYTSRIEGLALAGGMEYYLVIDGYGGASGEYVVTIDTFSPCALECPAGAELEGEPTIEDGYVDAHNGGCGNGGGVDNMQTIAPTTGLFCGQSGYYLSADGGASRDTDWFLVSLGAEGYTEITGDAEEASYMFELGPQDCNDVAVIQNYSIGPCSESTMTLVGPPDSQVWFWVGPQNFWDGDTHEFTYVLHIYYGGVAVENHSLSGVKSLFR